MLDSISKTASCTNIKVADIVIKRKSEVYFDEWLLWLAGNAPISLFTFTKSN